MYSSLIECGRGDMRSIGIKLTRILVSKRTVELAGNGLQFEQLGEMSVDGHEATVTVYAPLMAV